MNAHDRFLPDWFSRISNRQITLPRFQRHIAWGHNEVAGLLTTVLRGLPSGATLILEVGDEEKFVSRTMTDAPETGGKVTEQLLDGQQRLTALWRSMHDKYSDRKYLVCFEQADDGSKEIIPTVNGQARWLKNGNKYPLWVDDPQECWNRKLIPFHLLRPGDIQQEIDEWTEKAIPQDVDDRHEEYKKIYHLIQELRTKVREFNLPYLSLPPRTSKETALDVFIKMNTSSVRLSTYDIIVALVEEETGASLHDHVQALCNEVTRAEDYADVSELVLDIVALRQDRVPSQSGYSGIDYKKMVGEWDAVVSDIKGLVSFLEDANILDSQRLPSYTALPVLGALWEKLPTNPDSLGNSRLLLRKYMWRAFLTTRYEQSSATNALQDFRTLKKVISGEADETIVPIFNEQNYPLPSEDTVLHTEWPKRKTIIGRGLLCLQMKCGAEDIADGARASISALSSGQFVREYHHLFPEALLEEAGIDNNEIYRAVNCALITWRTNRTLSRKDPVQYLRERAESSFLGEEELKRRLQTHLVPFTELAVGYDGLYGEEKYQKIRRDYKVFTYARASIFCKAAYMACNGLQLDLNKLFSANYGSPHETA